jgi:hypothetical protein
MKRAFAKTSPARCRRFAVGLDVAPSEVRAVVVSQRLSGPAEVRIEHIGQAPVPADAVTRAEILEPPAVAAAIVQALANFRRHGVAASLRAAMALPPHAMVVATLPQSQCLTDLARRAADPPFVPGVPDRAVMRAIWQGITRSPGDPSLDRLEPGVRAQAEALSGIERSALALDWFAAGGAYVPADHLTIAAAAQQHVDARLEAAAGAGLHLVAIDAEPVAALRACRFDAAREVSPDEIYAVLWFGGDSLYLWALQRAQRLRELRLPLVLPNPQELLGALGNFLSGLSTQLAQQDGAVPDNPLGCVWVAGELEQLCYLGISLDTIGDALACPAFEFDACCGYVDAALSTPHAAPSQALGTSRPGVLAVAFGLALRGVWS